MSTNTRGKNKNKNNASFQRRRLRVCEVIPAAALWPSPRGQARDPRLRFCSARPYKHAALKVHLGSRTPPLPLLHPVCPSSLISVSWLWLSACLPAGWEYKSNRQQGVFQGRSTRGADWFRLTYQLIGLLVCVSHHSWEKLLLKTHLMNNIIAIHEKTEIFKNWSCFVLIKLWNHLFF